MTEFAEGRRYVVLAPNDEGFHFLLIDAISDGDAYGAACRRSITYP